MKFEEYFKEPQFFTDDTYVVSGSYSREDAAVLLAETADEPVLPEHLREDRARFGFPPEHIVDCDAADGAIWYTGASGVGSKPVWVLGG
jgi:hypothetical protein